MKRIALILALCLALSGCGTMGYGAYINIQPHEDQGGKTHSSNISATDRESLRAVMEELVAVGTERAVIQIGEYPQDKAAADMEQVVQHITGDYPIGAYAVESITYEVGLSGGVPAVSVSVSYLHGRSELRLVQTVADMEEAAVKIGEALTDCETGLVLLVEDYMEMDIDQMAADFADENPHVVMETPQVTVGLYPEEGRSRVVELIFTYQSSRDTLRLMRSQVEPVFNAARLYVSGDGSAYQKYSQLYAFLMERYEYTVKTSITPSYSLLRHGVGDSKAFATVYAAMCRQAGLECHVILGTRSGEPWYWNMICEDEYYYHVDLLASSEHGRFRRLTDPDMTGYVWDYSAYPEAPGEYIPPVDESVVTPPTVPAQKPSVPVETPTDPTQPPTVPPTEPPTEKPTEIPTTAPTELPTEIETEIS